MDVHALQLRLRRFAAERGWQPYQTPKNLAMAMTAIVSIKTPGAGT